MNKEGVKAPKWGFTALKAGSKISLVVDTEGHLEGSGKKNSSGLVELSLAYLRSYEHMGMARVTCSGEALKDRMSWRSRQLTHSCQW